jgi:carbon storage regulator
MLVLSRKIDEEIYLGGDISIKIVDISKNVVKLGVNAPSNMIILRGELRKKIEETNIEAIKSYSQDSINDLSSLFKK